MENERPPSCGRILTPPPERRFVIGFGLPELQRTGAGIRPRYADYKSALRASCFRMWRQYRDAPPSCCVTVGPSGRGGESYGSCMEVVWNSYGIPMVQIPISWLIGGLLLVSPPHRPARIPCIPHTFSGQGKQQAAQTLPAKLRRVQTFVLFPSPRRPSRAAAFAFDLATARAQAIPVG